MNRTSRSLLSYWAVYHPSIANFRWDHSAWGSSWTFIAISLSAYLLLLAILKLTGRWIQKPLRLGFLAGVYSLTLSLIRLWILVGSLEASSSEITNMWVLWNHLWRSNGRGKLRAGIEWAICFPIGTRSAGPVFFWSYAFYLTTYMELGETFVVILRRQSLGVSEVLQRVTAVVMCFCWLEFTQSMQIVGISLMTVDSLLSSLNGFGCAERARRIWGVCEWVTIGMASVRLIGLHFSTSGCNGIHSLAVGAFGFALSLCFRAGNRDREKEKYHIKHL